MGKMSTMNEILVIQGREAQSLSKKKKKIMTAGNDSQRGCLANNDNNDEIQILRCNNVSPQICLQSC